MISVRFPASGGAAVRLSRAFLSAPPDVLDSLSVFLHKRSKSSWSKVTSFIHTLAPARGESPTVLRAARGRVHDLDAIQDAVKRRYFNGRVQCAIRWGRLTAPRARRRSIRFGSYDRTRNLISVNPRLDDARVPREFVEYIVFHEMLHAVAPSVRREDSWSHHHASFRALEKSYPSLKEMKRLAKTLMRTLR